MRNQNGVTMVSLVIYVFAFVIIIGIVGAVTTFFSNNVGGLNESAGKNAEYNKFNIYMSNYTKNGYSVFLGNDDEENYTRPYMIFEKDDEQIVVEKIDDVLYVDNAKLCDKVEEFEADKTTTDNGQDVLRTKININGTVYTNDYILEEGRVADDEDQFDNSESLVLGFVDDTGTNSIIYLYNNVEKITSGTITITMPDSTTSTITAIADTSTISNTANYTAYTVSKNGVYEFQATSGTTTTTTKIRVKNIEKFTDVSTLGLDYAKNDQSAYNYNGAAIPNGYYVDTKSKVSTGLVITDEIDSEGYSTGNEWVWVPVNESIGNNEFYINGSGTMVGTNVTYTKYSKLWSFATNSETGVTTRTDLSNPQVQPSAGSGIREPAILTSQTYGEVVKYNLINDRKTGNAFENVEGVATQYVTDFNNMCDSVDKYGGFYIGRYELTANGEKPGSAIQQIQWVDAYNQSMMLGKEYTETGMIYDTLWDATACWLSKSGYNVGVSIDNYIAYGNCRFEQVSVSNELVKIILKSSGSPAVFKTGQLSYSKTNNIFDLNGNMGERTQGSEGYYYKVMRGGNYNSTIASGYITYRSHAYLIDGAWTTGSRPCLYIKTNNEQPIDNSQSLVSALVDDLGTRSTIYLYNNTNKITSGTITVTMPNGTTKNITALSDTSTLSSTSNYATYTVAQNGTYKFQATDGTNTTTTTVEVKNIERFTDVSLMGLAYCNNENKAYNYNGAAVPVGYYVDTRSDVNTGLVITDAVDNNGYSIGNEWVWVPVNSTVGNNDFYINETGTVVGTSVQYTKYGKLYSFVEKTREAYGTFHAPGGNITKPSNSVGYREPVFMSHTSNGDLPNIGSINKRSDNTPFTEDDGVDAVALQYVTDFNNMCNSVDKYGGFFIGRYEITANGEKPGTSLTNQNWYQYYNRCMTYGKDNTDSGMMYGTLWDATLRMVIKM